MKINVRELPGRGWPQLYVNRTSDVSYRLEWDDIAQVWYMKAIFKPVTRLEWIPF